MKSLVGHTVLKFQCNRNACSWAVPLYDLMGGFDCVSVANSFLPFLGDLKESRSSTQKESSKDRLQ